jgi:hypothetical protein
MGETRKRREGERGRFVDNRNVSTTENREQKTVIVTPTTMNLAK